MTDLTDIQAAEPIRIIGADTSGTETTPVGSATDGSLITRDSPNLGGLDGILNLTTTPAEGHVGVARMVNRRFIIAQAQSNNVKWGYTAGTQNFDLYKNQTLIMPCGDQTGVWFKVSTGTGTVVIGEV